MTQMLIYFLVLIFSRLPYCVIQAQTFCRPAEAFLVAIRLNEVAPLNGMTCTTVDGISGFFSMVPEVLLTPGVVIPANCTIQQLVNYNCQENLNFNSGKKYKTKSYSTGSSVMGANIDIKTLILCNACQVTNSVPTCLGSYGAGGIDPDNLIDQQRLPPTLNIGGLSFTVEAFVKEQKEQRTRGGGSKHRGRSYGHGHHHGSHSHYRTRYGYYSTKQKGGGYYQTYYCNNQFISSYYTTHLQEQCECPMECML